MNEVEKFFKEVAANIEALGGNQELREMSRLWVQRITPVKYAYNFTWMGRPIIQLPMDIMAMQEILWRVQPEVVVECGVAHGGSLVFYASMLELIGGKGFVIGVDIDIRAHNRKEIERHRMAKRIRLVEGSSTDPQTVRKVASLIGKRKNVLVALDSNHAHDHVLKELELYSPFVRKGSYLVVFDTVIEDMPEGFFPGKPWDKRNNPKTAVRQFLKSNDRFRIDSSMDAKLLISVAPEGYLLCVKNPRTS